MTVYEYIDRYLPEFRLPPSNELASENVCVSNGRIITPGQFQGEHALVVWAFTHYMSGVYDRDDGDGGLVFELNENETKSLTGKFKGATELRLTTDDQGFWHLNA